MHDQGARLLQAPGYFPLKTPPVGHGGVFGKLHPSFTSLALYCHKNQIFLTFIP
ncbi:hypothetical protein CFter6_1821 [Collimonas fungivorans]|uniref:Uncharacterized protein n=1 Tax=Collimonas fungivorans TaxID=158899 RepID=A0A127P9L4_9BURK|nr:hypothetical protein CFter6_1821 [Collimonas fungivorans]